MPRVLWGLVLVVAVAGGREASACGDKFLVIGRGVRQQRAQGARQSASILLYFDAAGQLASTVRDEKLDAHLKLAGHRVRSVAGPSELSMSIGTKQYDIVLAPLSEMAAVLAVIGSAPPRPVLLPVIHNPTGQELAQAEVDYGCVMRSPSTKKHYLAVIEEAMARRNREHKR
jgi:hypothetical protein